MNILSTVGDVAVSGLWKFGAIAALAGGLVISAALGYQWHMSAHDRDVARADLVAERAANDDLRTSIREQNRAVETMSEAKKAADARGQDAQRLAAANGRRFDGALDQIRQGKAATCDEAMPFVNQTLEAIK